MHRVLVAALLGAAIVLSMGQLTSASQPGQSPEPPRSELYRFVLLQAAPGRLLDLIELHRSRLPVIRSSGDQLPFIVRHSQGDHWDLAIIYPSGSWSDYYSRDRLAKREAAASASGMSNAEFARQSAAMAAWHEEFFVQGPPLGVFRAFVQGAGLAHFEMLQALPGKLDELITERERENTYNRERGRPHTLIFVHDQGAAWDVVTLDVFRNWRHFAEQETIPAEANDAAARKAGFANADAIGPYMRTLISTHRDTLGPIILVEPR